MRVLVLGGNVFVGRAMAEEALARGHVVTCVARGVSGPFPPAAHHTLADRDLDLSLADVGHHEWDVLIDVARHPGHVRRALEVLEGRTRHAVYISSLSAYRHLTPGGDESGALKDPLPFETISEVHQYGAAKVACERHYTRMFGAEHTSILRCGLIGGPGDVTGRSGWYTWRCAHPAAEDGSVLVPSLASRTAAILDVRDLASFAVNLAESHTAGAYDTLGPVTSLADHLAVARQVTRHTGRLVEAEPRWLRRNGVAHWMGPDTLPLWIDDPDYTGFNTHSGARAVEAGLQRRPLEETLADVLGYEEHRSAETPRKTGLSNERERALLQRVRR